MRWLLALSCIFFWSGFNRLEPQALPTIYLTESHQASFSTDNEPWEPVSLDTSTGINLLEEHEDEEVPLLFEKKRLVDLHRKPLRKQHYMEHEYEHEKCHYPPPEA